MAGRQALKDVIGNDYYNQIFDSLSEFVERNADRLDLSTRRVKSPEHAEVSDLDIQAVRIQDKGGFDIAFDVILSAEITVSEYCRSDVETDERVQWFLLRCGCTLDDGMQRFHIDDTSLYSKSRYESDGGMTESLVSIIKKDQFDAEATAFLQLYYPDALISPMALPVEEVASNMGLEVKRVSLTRNLTLFGMTIFADTSIRYYDRKNALSSFFGVGKGTILVDPDVCFMRNIGCERNTIIHECVHWHKHRKYHELAKACDPERRLVACRVSEKERGASTRWDDNDWMEWHANGIAPRILMPKDMARLKVDEYWHEYEEAYPSCPPMEAADYALKSIAGFFGVSKAAAKIRMLDLGYMEAAGLYVYVDDHYISPFSFPEESDSGIHSYSIGIKDAFFEYFINQSFMGYIDSGNFIYADGHYVINDPAYVEHNRFGGVRLTDYARGHFSECCLRFDLVLDDAAKPDVEVYLEFLAYKAATSSYKKKPGFSDDGHNQIILRKAEELKRMRDEIEEENLDRVEQGMDFALLARRHIEKSKLHRITLCERTLLGEKTFQRIANEDRYKPDMDTVMALCVGLQLSVSDSERLFASAGIALDGPPRNRIFKKILMSFHGHDIYSCNEALIELDEKPICGGLYHEMIDNNQN
jgi:hypothetical protein